MLNGSVASSRLCAAVLCAAIYGSGQFRCTRSESIYHAFLGFYIKMFFSCGQSLVLKSMNFDTSPSPRDGRRCDKSTPDRGVETSLLCAPNACLSSSATLGTRSARHDACSEPSAVGEAQTRAVGPTAATSLRRRSQMCGTCKHCYMGQKQLLKAAGSQQTAGHPEPRVSVQTVGLSWECSGCFRVFSAAPPQGVAGLIRQSGQGRDGSRAAVVGSCRTGTW